MIVPRLKVIVAVVVGFAEDRMMDIITIVVGPSFSRFMRSLPPCTRRAMRRFGQLRHHDVIVIDQSFWTSFSRTMRSLPPCTRHAKSCLQSDVVPKMGLQVLSLRLERVVRAL